MPETLNDSTISDTTTNPLITRAELNKVELNKALIDPATQEAGNKQRLENPVIDIQKTIELQIKQFEAELDATHEVMIKAASFGSAVIFYVDTIEFSKPNIIIFHGKTPEGERVRLIQHVNQTSCCKPINARKLQAQNARLALLIIIKFVNKS